MQQTEVGYLLLLAIVLAVVLGLRLGAGAGPRMGRKFTGTKPVYETCKTTFADVAANDEASGSLSMCRLPEKPEKYGKMGARMPRGVCCTAAGTARPSWHRLWRARRAGRFSRCPFGLRAMYGASAPAASASFFKGPKKPENASFSSMKSMRWQKAGRQRLRGARADAQRALERMSGFKKNSGAIVLAATNRLDTLDPALLRPGRFDRKIEVGLPGLNERLIFEASQPRKTAGGWDRPVKPRGADGLLQRRVAGGAAERSAIRAARRGSEEIERGDIDAAYLATVAGEDRPSHAAQKERATIALHEAGHALATKLLLPVQRVPASASCPPGRARGLQPFDPAGVAIIGGSASRGRFRCSWPEGRRNS
jgi:cell division protease FtsH